MRHYYAHWTWSSHVNSSPARLLVTRDMRLFVTRDLTFWHFDYFTMRCPETMSDPTFWHVWVWRYDFRRGCQSRLVTVKNWKTFYLLAAYDNRWKTICHWRHLYVLISWGCFWSLKKEIGLSTGEKKKSLEGTLSFSNWVLNIRQKGHGYCFIFKPSLYYIYIKIILFCLYSQYVSSRSVTHDKSRA